MSARPLTMVATAADPVPAPDTSAPLSRVALLGAGAWMVTAGYVNVFASPAAGRPSAGRRYHLFRATAGAVVFGLPSSDEVSLEAVGTDGTRLTPIGRDGLDERLLDPAARVAMAKSIGWWIDRLCDYVSKGLPPAASVAYLGGQEAVLPEGGCVRPARGVAAVELLDGTARLFGRDIELTHGQPVPVSWRTWLDAGPATTLRLTSWQEVVSRGDTWTALDALHQAALTGITARIGEIAESERSGYSRRSGSIRAAAAAALGTLAATFHDLSPEQTAARAPSVSDHDRLNAACRLVTGRLGVPFVNPAATSYRNLKEGVENVARASSCRARQVTLGAEWWLHEQGPLLGFLKADNHPVALLPRARSGYDLVDPDAPAPRRIDAAVADTMLPRAVTFYRPFGNAPVDFLQLARFGVRGCQRELAMVIATGVIAGLIGMGVPIVTGLVINSIIPATDRLQLTQWVFVLLACVAATTMVDAVRSIALIRLEMKLGYAIQAAVWDRLISLPAPFFRNYSSGSLATRAMGIDAVRQTLSGSTIRGVLGGIFSVFNFALLFYYDAALAIGASALIATAVGVLVAISYVQRIQQRESVALAAKSSGLILQLLTGIRKLRVAGAEVRAFGIWAALAGQQRKTIWKISSLAGMWKTFATALPMLSYATLFSVILATSSGNAVRTGDFVAFMAAFAGCTGAILATAGAVIAALSVVPQYEMAQPILQALPEISPGQADPGVLSGDIRVDRVVFGYQADTPPVLNDLSFHVKAGEFVAFVGPSGSGKSTILRLLLGFETPHSGGVAFDSRDFKDLDVRAVRRQIGVVLQNGRLMPGDIFTNIVGCSSATMDEAWAACRAAGFEEDLKRMPMEMHTMVTDGGGTLSGGQRQRLMIARAIVTAPRMVFFDEATSALDNRTQAVVSQSLEQLRATRVVIAHRLSTIINADCIYVVDKGRIVQQGSYTDLMAQPGPFRDLASRQLA